MLKYPLALIILTIPFLLYYFLFRRKRRQAQTRIYHGYIQYRDNDGEWKYEHRRVAEKKD